MDTVTLLFFAQAAKLTGRDRDEWAVPEPIPLAGLREQVLARYPALASLSGALRWAVDEALVDDTAVVRAGQTVAVMPPFSGG